MPRDMGYDRHGVRDFSVPRLQVELLSEHSCVVEGGYVRKRLKSLRKSNACAVRQVSVLMTEVSMRRPLVCGGVTFGGAFFRVRHRLPRVDPQQSSDSVPRPGPYLVMQSNLLGTGLLDQLWVTFARTST